MKKALIFTFAIWVKLSAIAQITITGTDLPQPNETYIRANSVALFIDVDATGPNTNWDYSDLTLSSIDTIIFNSVSQTPALYQFSFNNPLTPAYKATDAIPSANLELGPISLTDSYTYFKTSGSERTEVGRGVSFSGLPIPIKYDDIKSLLPLPLTYGASLTDDFAYDLTLPNFITLGQEGNIQVAVDGWGQIYLPQDTFDVIRVKTETFTEDTIFLDTLGFGIKVPSTTITYDWYAKNMGIPVLSITKNGMGITTNVNFFYTPQFPASVKESDFTQLRVYPNPAKQQINIDGLQGNYHLKVFSLTGKQLLTLNGANQSILDISDLAKGMYILQINSANTSHSIPIIKE